MAFYYGKCDGDCAFLDTATGASPEEVFDGEYTEITEEYYKVLLAEQCAGNVIVDTGANFPASKDQGCGSCTCVKVPKLKVETPETDASWAGAAVQLRRGGVAAFGDVTANVNADGTSVTAILGAVCNGETAKVIVGRDSTGGAFSVENVKSVTFAVKNDRNTGGIEIRQGVERTEPASGDTTYAQLTIRPSEDYGADLGDNYHKFGTVHCGAVHVFKDIYGIEKPLARALPDADYAVGSIGLFLHTHEDWETSILRLDRGSLVAGTTLTAVSLCAQDDYGVSIYGQMTSLTAGGTWKLISHAGFPLANSTFEGRCLGLFIRIA